MANPGSVSTPLANTANGPTTIPLRCSFFSRANDNVPRNWVGPWPQLVDRLRLTYYPDPGTNGEAAKKSLAAICPTRFKEGCKRGSEAALDLSLLILDIDNSAQVATGEYWRDPRTGEPTNRPKLRKVMIHEPVTFDEVQKALHDAGVCAYIWTTWNASPEWPKIRAVVPFGTPVPAEFWEPTTEWALDRLGLGSARRGLDLPVVRDVARLNFLPAAPTPDSILRAETHGVHLFAPLEQLAQINVPPLPMSQWQQEIQAARSAGKHSGEKWYRHYQVNGRPVDFQALDLAALLHGRGIKVGRPRIYGGGTKWRCHCPWACEHSQALDDDSAVVMQSPGHWPVFHCSHSHHAHLGLQDLIELFWGRP